MKVTIIANISTNGRVLLSDNPHHQLPPEAMEFYIHFARDAGNLVIGTKTFENFQRFPKEVKQLFEGIEIIILSGSQYTVEGFKTVRSPEEAMEYISSRGFDEIAVGGGGATYNSFIDKGLVTDIYLNISPIITGAGNVLGNNIEMNTSFRLKKHTVKNNFIQLHLTREHKL